MNRRTTLVRLPGWLGLALAVAGLAGLDRPARADEVFLRNGNRLEGAIVRLDERIVVLRMAGSAEITLDRAAVLRIVDAPDVAPVFPPSRPAPPPRSTPPAPAAPAASRPAGEVHVEAAPGPAEKSPSDPAERPAASEAELESTVRALLTAPASPEETTLELIELGPPPLPVLLSALAHEPTERALDVLSHVLARGSAGDPGGRLVEFARPTSPHALRPPALQLLGRLGDARHLEPLSRLWSLGEAESEAPVSDAFREILVRRPGPESEEALRRLLAGADAGVAGRVANAVADAGRESDRTLLAAFLGGETILQPTLVAAVSRLAAGRDDPELGDRLGRLLDGRPDADLRREVALALGRIREVDSVARLIDLLDDESDGVRRAARWALGRISGRELPPEREAWLGWLQAERDWWTSCGAPRLAERTGMDDAGLFESVRLWSQRPLFRRAVEPALLELLAHPREGIRAVACQGLGALGCVATLPSLEALLDDPAAMVRASAAEACARLRERHAR